MGTGASDGTVDSNGSNSLSRSRSHGMSRRTYWISVSLFSVAALSLYWPVLRSGFIIDDFAQLGMITGTYPVPRAPLALFTFSDGSLSENAVLRAVGFLPWWSNPLLRISLFRPLASAIMWCDWYCFGHDAYAYHLHGVLWWLAMLLLWAAVARRLLPGWAALLVVAAAALHPAQVGLLGWIANRNALEASVFALSALLFQLRARQDGVRAGRALAIVCAALALGCSEYALAFLVYPVAYELDSDDPVATRVRRLVPWFALLGVYATTRAALGFGARMSGMYVDPTLEPLAFLRGALDRLPILVGDLTLALHTGWWAGGFPWVIKLRDWGLVPSWLATVMGYFRSVQVAFGLISLGVVALIGQHVLRERRAGAKPSVAFVAWGLPLALVPLLGSTPQSRLMLPAAFGWSILLARFSVAVWAARAAAEGGWLRRNPLVPALLWSVALIVPLLTCSTEARNFPRLAEAVRASILDPRLDSSITADSRVLLASALDPTTTLYVPLLRHWYGRVVPASCHLLLGATSRVRLQRLSDRSFSLDREDRDYTLSDAYADIFNRERLRRGQHFSAGPLAITIEQALEGRPMHVRYELDVSLDDPRAVLLVQSTQGLLRRAFPAPGQSVWLEQALLPLDLLPP
jgi:hypothetical protein